MPSDQDEGALALDCRTIAVQRPRDARALSRASAALLVSAPLVMLAALLLALVGVRTGIDMPAEVRDTLIAAWFFGVPATALASAIAASGGRERSGRVLVDEDGLVAMRGGRQSMVKAADVAAGLVVPTMAGPAVDLQLTNGRVLRLGVDTEAQAHAILDRLGVGPERRRVSVALRTGNASLLAGCVAFPVSVVLAVFALVAVGLARPRGSDAELLTTVALGMLATVLVPLAVRRLARAPEVVIGAEGVVLRGPLRTRQIRFEEIDRVHGDGGELTIDLHARAGADVGERIALRSDPSLTTAIADRVHEAMTLGRSEARAAAAALLDPGARPVAAWREALAQLLRRGADYRSASLDADDLVAVLEDASAPPARRIGAALALREGDVPEARQRVRIAADACADDDTRAALEAAVAEEIDEAPIRKVIRAEERG